MKGAAGAEAAIRAACYWYQHQEPDRDLARRLDRSVNPIGMTVDLYASGKKYIPDNLPKALRTAEKMAVEAIDPLRDLAAAIVAAGGLGCEHESRYVVLRTLSEQLSRLE